MTSHVARQVEQHRAIAAIEARLDDQLEHPQVVVEALVELGVLLRDPIPGDLFLLRVGQDAALAVHVQGLRLEGGRVHPELEVRRGAEAVGVDPDEDERRGARQPVDEVQVLGEALVPRAEVVGDDGGAAAARDLLAPGRRR